MVRYVVRRGGARSETRAGPLRSTGHVGALTQEADRLYQAGRAASDDGRPGTAVRRYRAALRLAAEPELRGRILISLAWAESERGHLRRGFRLLDEAEPLLPAHLRGILYGQ